MLNWLIPQFCPACPPPQNPLLGLFKKRLVRPKDPICSHCSKFFAPLSPPWCEMCGRPLPSSSPRCGSCLQQADPHSIRSMRSLWRYSEEVGRFIGAIKFKGETALLKWAASQTFEHFGKELFSGIDALVPVPLSSKSFSQRLFNQTVLLSKHLSRLSGIPDHLLLEKLNETPPQRELPREARLKNLKGAFRLRNKYKTMAKEGGTILLIDDVLTTGATLKECAQVLKEAGFDDVRAFTLARNF
ncbi:MAG: ComF family protein [Deltaproteobacteria bacterium]|nr:ComF family protein [Deltaproteobacteria bacterium]